MKIKRAIFSHPILKTFSFGILLSLTSQSSVGKTKNTLHIVDPTFEKVLEAFWQHNPIDRSEFHDLRRRALQAARLPQIYLGYDHAFRSAQGISVTDNISVTSSAVNIGPQDNNYDYDENLGKTFRVRAVWKLDELIYRNDLLAIEKDHRQLYLVKQQTTKELFKIYQMRSALKPQCTTTQGTILRTGKCASFFALNSYLDAVTGGLFENASSFQPLKSHP